MALTGNINLSQVRLIDKFPGAVNNNLGIPTGGWDNTTDNFTTTSIGQAGSYPLGTKIMAYTDSSYVKGWYTMAYLMYHSFESVDISADYSDGLQVCSHFDNSDAEKYILDISACPYYVVSNELTAANSDISSGAGVAFPCFTLESDGTKSSVANQSYGDAYGWFWIGGVCPCRDVTRLDGTLGLFIGVDISCDTLMRKGPVMFCASGQYGMFSIDSSGFQELTTMPVTMNNGVSDLAQAYVDTSAKA